MLKFNKSSVKIYCMKFQALHKKHQVLFFGGGGGAGKVLQVTVLPFSQVLPEIMLDFLQYNM